MKRVVVILFVVSTLVGAGAFVYAVFFKTEPTVAPEPAAPTVKTETIGQSVQGRAIVAHTYGDGPEHLLFVGGIHGGYEWNSVSLAYQFIDYLTLSPETVPDNLTVTVIPVANPDGLYKVVGGVGRFTIADVSADGAVTAAGRFNANSVDLNRNFDCKWQPRATWRGEVVSAGTAAFSEPEARALRDFVLKNHPDAVVFWHSQANAVYASECEAGVLPGTRAVMNAYAGASGYPAVDSFDAYEITGDAEGWLASIHIPAITVELATHESVEWERNLAGTMALLTLFTR